MNQLEKKTEAQKADELKRLKEWIKKLLPDAYDKYDTEAKYDSTLTYAENKSAIREDLKLLINDMTAQVEQAKAEQERQEYEEKKELEEKKAKAEEEVMQWNSTISFDKKPEIDFYYLRVHRAIQKIAQNYSFLAFIKGRGGIGKSTHVRKALHLAGMKAGEDYLEVTGEVTEAYLYRLIFENNGKILWFKDVAKLLQGMNSINLLKAATETEENRILTKNSYSKKQDDLPDRFLCRCKFIFDYNNLWGLSLRDDFEALISRGEFIELAFQDEEMAHIMKLIAKGNKVNEEVTNFLISNYKSTGLFRLNLRTQYKALKTYEFANQNGYDWKEEIIGEIKNTSKTRALLYSIMGNKAIRTTELKKRLLKYEMVSSLRTADRRVTEWIFIEELFRWDENERDGFVSINPRPRKEDEKHEEVTELDAPMPDVQ